MVLQDEWSIGVILTLNHGVRYDHVAGLVSEGQNSPRAGRVWKPNGATNIHAGYARCFTPPPLELISFGNQAAFAGTTGEAASSTADPVRAEREHNFDLGAQQKVGILTPGSDACYKIKRNLLDEGQFGATLIQSPFNYAKSQGWGIEFSASHEQGAAVHCVWTTALASSCLASISSMVTG